MTLTMIAKTVIGRSIRGCLNYLSNEAKGAKLIQTNMAGKTPRQLASQFKAFRLLRPSLGKAVLHVSLSMPPDERPISDEEWSAIACDYLQGMGYGLEMPYAVFRHHDTPHEHIHIVAGRIRPDGTVLSDSNDWRKSHALVRSLEKKHGLKTVISSKKGRKPLTRGQQQLKNRKGGTPMVKENLIELLDRAIRSAKDLTQFMNLCNVAGIGIIPNMQGEHVSGITYDFSAFRFKGSDLGRSYTWAGIINHPHLSFDPDIHIALIRAMLDASRSNCIEVDMGGDERMRRLYQYQLTSTDYQNRVKDVFGDDLNEFVQVKGKLIFTTKSGGRISDCGDKLYAEGLPPVQSAKYLIAIAKEKKWKEVSVSGGGGFVMEAMNEALDAGMTVVPKNEEQKQLLAEVIEQRNERANANVAEDNSSSGISQKVAQRRLNNYMNERPKPSYKPSGA